MSLKARLQKLTAPAYPCVVLFTLRLDGGKKKRQLTHGGLLTCAQPLIHLTAVLFVNKFSQRLGGFCCVVLACWAPSQPPPPSNTAAFFGSQRFVVVVMAVVVFCVAARCMPLPQPQHLRAQQQQRARLVRYARPELLAGRDQL